MTLTAILFVVAAASTALAADECPPETDATFYTVPLKTVPEKYVYCHTYVVEQQEQFCTLEIKAEDNETADFTIKLYNTVNNEVGKKEFGFSKQSRANAYDITGIPGLKAVAYITEAWVDETKTKMCFSCFKCYSGGKFGGAENSGIQANVICNNPSLCEGPAEELLKNLKQKANLEGAEFKKLKDSSCKEKKLTLS